MPEQPWTKTLSQLNRRLDRDGVQLHGQPIKLKVRHKAREDGSRAIDVYGRFEGPQKDATRSTGIALTPGTYEIRLDEAMQEALQLVERARQGEDTRAPRGWRPSQEPAGGLLARQLNDARAFLKSRSEHRRLCGPRQLKDQLRWLQVMGDYAQQQGQALSMATCLRGLAAHFGGVDSSTYRKATTVAQMICKKLDLPEKFPDELIPQYQYDPKPRINIPKDSVISERLKNIQDPYEAQLIYSVVVYGRRISEIYYADWPNLAANGDLPVYAAKNKKRGMSWPIPFGDEDISLQGFRPPEWDELQSIDQRPTGEKARRIKAHADKISALIKKRLGCDATDLRHRWGIVCITSPDYQEDLIEIASALLTSITMLEKTYIRELREYRQQRQRFHAARASGQ